MDRANPHPPNPTQNGSCSDHEPAAALPHAMLESWAGIQSPECAQQYVSVVWPNYD
jgi:hypothetical protein